MAIEQIDFALPHEQWELEEPRPRRWSPVEFDFMLRSGLLPPGEADLSSGGRLFTTAGEPWRWTAESYERMGELGLLGPGERVELFDGEVLEMSPQLSYHATGVSLAREALAAAFGPSYYVRLQLPIRPLPHEEPEPDLAVVRGRIRDFTHAHPVHALLVLEVSDSTLRFDLRGKASLYASVGITDYWVTDIPHMLVHVHRDPVPDKRYRHGFRYTSIRTFGPGEQIVPIALPEASIAVNDLLPILPGEETE